MLDHSTEVTAADFVRKFSRYREIANSRPITITHHGRKTHVLLPIKDYLDTSTVRDLDADPYALLLSFAEWVDDGMIICDRELQVQFANRTMQAIMGKGANAVVGKSLTQAIPEADGNLILVHARRAAIGNAPSIADVPCPFRENAWLNIQCIPLRDRIVFLFKDISEDVQRNRLADVKTALLEGMTVLGSVAYVRASVRGTIDYAGESFCAMVGLPDDRLVGVALSDLVERSDRVNFRDSLEQVLRGEGSRKLDAKILRNDGSLMQCTMSFVQLQGAYGTEGVVIMVQPHE